MTDIEKLPVEEVVVESKPSGLKSKIGDDEFVKDFIKIVKVGPPWRSAKKIAEILGVDPNDLSVWLDKQDSIVRRPGKEEGTVYYAWIKRLEIPNDKRPPGMERKQITEEDRYLIGQMHLLYSTYVKVLEKYALHAHSRNKEGFAKLVEARDAMSAGISLMANTLQIDVSKLPPL